MYAWDLVSGSTDYQVNIAGFTFLGKNREHKRGGGVGMYLQNDLKYNIRTDIYSNNENTCELLGIEIVNYMLIGYDRTKGTFR